MSVSEKYTTLITEKIPAVFEAGKKQGDNQSEIASLWESRKQSIGNNWIYTFAGRSWNDETFGSIPFDLVLSTDSALSMFSYSTITNLKQILENNGVTLDISNVKTVNTMFFYSSITHLPKIDLSSATSTTSIFGYMRQLIYIEEVVFSETTNMTDLMFHWCDKLEHLRIGGGIYKNGLNLQWSPLSHDSLMSIINALVDKSGDTSGTTWEVTLGETNLAKLTTEEIGIADAKGWLLG